MQNAFCVIFKQHNIWAFNILHSPFHLNLCFFKANKYKLGGQWSKFNYVFHIGGGVISWQSHKQLIVALSSTKYKYITTNACAQEALWLWQILKDLNFPRDGPTCLHCDNQSCIKFTQKVHFHEHSKHIELYLTSCETKLISKNWNFISR